MREILFRGKRKDNGEWVEGGIIPLDAESGYVFIVEPYLSASTLPLYEIIKHHTHLVDSKTVGQYTGKTVKNGRVFDGDIGKSIDGIFLVCWDEEKAAFIMRFLEYPFETLYLEEMWDDAEIIGNIHDNPELLKEGGE